MKSTQDGNIFSSLFQSLILLDYIAKCFLTLCVSASQLESWKCRKKGRENMW